MILLTTEPIDIAAITEAVRSPHAGAVCVFFGTVRDLTGNQSTAFLNYEAYAPMAEEQMAAIAQEICQRWPILGLRMIHRLGRLAVGDISVAVAVSCPHRAEAFAACQYGIDTLKDRVPIWKQDIAPDGKAAWIHPETQ